MKQSKKLLNQTEIADKLGISKSTVSRWISTHNVAEQVVKNQKLYDAAIVQQIKKSRKKSVNESAKGFSSIELLQEMIKQQQDEITLLKSQLEVKDKQLEKELSVKNNQIEKLSQLTSEAHVLAHESNSAKNEILNEPNYDHNDAERANTEPISSNETDNSSKHVNKPSFFKRIFKK